METKYIDIDGYWGVIVIYDYDLLDYDDLWAIMRSFGLSSDKADEALRVLSHANTGMAISNDDIRMSSMFISHATDESEWWSTIAHEIRHVVDAIIEYYGRPLNSESAAHLQGYILKRVIEEIELPCDY